MSPDAFSKPGYYFIRHKKLFFAQVSKDQWGKKSSLFCPFWEAILHNATA